VSFRRKPASSLWMLIYIEILYPFKKNCRVAVLISGFGPPVP
jgi:hypothetical protein